MTKFLKGECSSCGGHIEFPAEAVGSTVDCPHCGKPTELLLAAPPQTSSLPIKTIVYTIVAVLILVGGLVGTMIALKRAKRLAENKAKTVAVAQPTAPTKPANPFAEIGFWASPVTLEKVTGSSLVYAVGTVRSLTNRQRFGVTVELDLLDANGQSLNGETNRTTDYQAVIEPKSEWRYRAPVRDKKAASAKVVAIKEQN
jgi:hypothetical protein